MSGKPAHPAQTQRDEHKPDPERDAAEELSSLLRFADLQKNDYAAKISRLEAFIDKHPTSDSGPRAQLALRALRQQAVDNQAPIRTPEPPPAPTPATSGDPAEVAAKKPQPETAAPPSVNKKAHEEAGEAETPAPPAIVPVKTPDAVAAKVPPAIALDAGLIGYWPLDDGSGKVAADASGQGHNGKLGLSIGWGTGIIGGAAKFDGHTHYLDIPGVSTAGTAFTVSCWVHHSSLTSRKERYLTFGDEIAVLKHNGNGELSFSLKTDAAHALRVKRAMSAKKWSLITGTWDGVTQKLYQDGVMLQQQAPGGTAKAPEGLKLGGFVVQGFYGQIDDVRVYNRALTPEEVAALAAMGTKK